MHLRLAMLMIGLLSIMIVPLYSEAQDQLVGGREYQSNESATQSSSSNEQAVDNRTSTKSNSNTSSKWNEGELTYPPDVEIEKSVFTNNALRKNCDCEYTYFMPYRQRRNTFGFILGIGYSTFAPTNYKPDFVVNQTFQDYYGTSEAPLMDLTLGLKWNMGLGSLAFELGGGYYFNNSVNVEDGAVLTVEPVRGALTLTLDILFSEPYVAPYVSFGGYTDFYHETIASQSVRGNTPIGMYYAGGLLFQLNWLDESSAVKSYDSLGLQNTYIFGEARSFISTTDTPNLGTEPQLGAGLKLEF